MRSGITQITSSTQDGIDVFRIERRGLREVFATVVPSASDDLISPVQRLQRLLQRLRAEVLEMRIFGSIDAHPDCNEALLGQFGRVEWPVTYIQGKSCLGRPIAGIQAHAVSGVSVETIWLDGHPAGRAFEDDHARYCVLGDLCSHDRATSRTAQARGTLEKLENGLALAEMDLHCVIRTWFFINDILEWYSGFNAARSETYAARGMFNRYLPASTGIGGRNPDDAAVVAAALAMQAKGDDVVVMEIPSPLQPSPREYGSSFSRAVEVRTPDCRSVYISGTASIDRGGRSAHEGDIDAQIRRTLEVVGVLLRSRGMRFSDVARANAYFKHPAEAGALNRYAGDYGLPLGRVIVSHNDICRSELLFEIEVDAVKCLVQE